MARRTGLRTLRDLAHRMCKLISTWLPVIERVYGNQYPTLIVALVAVQGTCSELVEAADEALPTGT